MAGDAAHQFSEAFAFFDSDRCAFGDGVAARSQVDGERCEVVFGWLELVEIARGEVSIALKRGAVFGDEGPAEAELLDRLHIRNADEDGFMIFAQVRAAGEKRFLAFGAVEFEMR